MANITGMTNEIIDAMEKLEELQNLLEEFGVESELNMTDSGLFLNAKMWYCGDGRDIKVIFAAQECDDYDLDHCVEIIHGLNPVVDEYFPEQEEKKEE